MRISPSLCAVLWYVHAYPRDLWTQRTGAYGCGITIVAGTVGPPKCSNLECVLPILRVNTAQALQLPWIGRACSPRGGQTVGQEDRFVASSAHLALQPSRSRIECWPIPLIKCGQFCTERLDCEEYGEPIENEQ